MAAARNHPCQRPQPRPRRRQRHKQQRHKTSPIQTPAASSARAGRPLLPIEKYLLLPMMEAARLASPATMTEK